MDCCVNGIKIQFIPQFILILHASVLNADTVLPERYRYMLWTGLYAGPYYCQSHMFWGGPLYVNG